MSKGGNWYRNLVDILLEKYKKLDSDINSEEIIKEVKARKTKEFVGIIFRELGKLLDEQVYEKKNGEVVIPPKVIVFLSDKDDKEWRGAKREALKEDLESICLEKVKEIAGKSISIIDSVEIELKVDGGLEEGKVYAIHRWEDDETEEETTKIMTVGDEDEDSEKTIPFNTISSQIFFIEVWHKGEKQKEWKFFQNQIIIGRNSDKKGKVDLHLANDLRIARLHAILQIDKDGVFWITAQGDNQTKVGSDIILPNRTVKVGDNQEIQIIDFTLKLRK